jgi:hypothetical protein
MKTPVLIIEDGFEYIDRAHHWLAEHFEFTRAGNGAEALALLKESAFGLIYLDMNFNRISPEALLGPWQEVADRFGGDRDQAKAFLETHQGVYILAAIREAGSGLPVLISYDFAAEPKRWKHLASRYAPLLYLSDNAGPDQIRSALIALQQEA